MRLGAGVWRKLLRRSAWIFGISAAVVLPLGGRVWWEARAELAAADDARSQDKTDLEIVHLGRAARWRLPLVGHDEVALDRLMRIGKEHEVLEDGQAIALRAYREARSAIVATRAWDLPHRPRFEEANQRIAALMAAQEKQFGTDLSERGEQEAYHLALLEEAGQEERWIGNLAAVAFVGWLLTTLTFVRRAIDPRGQLRARAGLFWGAWSLVTLIAWMVLWRLS